ncbi:MAG: GAF domain-containing protein [Pseudomonadota bacterium]
MPSQKARQRALRMIDDGAPLRDILAFLTTTVEVSSNHETVASILLIDRDGLLRNGASPNLPADYLDAIDRLKPDPYVGTCAAAAATGEIVITRDFHEDSRWAELRHLPLALGFRGAWSMPIKNDAGRVLGTFGTYFRERREPTEGEMALVTQLMPVAARAIAHAGALH